MPIQQFRPTTVVTAIGLNVSSRAFIKCRALVVSSIGTSSHDRSRKLNVSSVPHREHPYPNKTA